MLLRCLCFLLFLQLLQQPARIECEYEYRFAEYEYE